MTVNTCRDTDKDFLARKPTSSAWVASALKLQPTFFKESSNASVVDSQLRQRFKLNLVKNNFFCAKCVIFHEMYDSFDRNDESNRVIPCINDLLPRSIKCQTTSVQTVACRPRRRLQDGSGILMNYRKLVESRFEYLVARPESDLKASFLFGKRVRLLITPLWATVGFCRG